MAYFIIVVEPVEHTQPVLDIGCDRPTLDVKTFDLGQTQGRAAPTPPRVRPRSIPSPSLMWLGSRSFIPQGRSSDLAYSFPKVE